MFPSSEPAPYLPADPDRRRAIDLIHDLNTRSGSASW